MSSGFATEPAPRRSGSRSEFPPRQRYLAALDVFVLTSRSEGLPLVVLEAWAAGVPVVASAVGGLPKVIDPGRTGLLFPSGNEAALAEALVGLLTDAQARGRLSDQG